MIFVLKEKLPVVVLREAQDTIGFEELKSALRQHLSEFIYFEYENRLFGLVSLGDISRTCAGGRTAVKINTSFTHVGKGDYIRAREMFLNNSRIHALPATTEDGEFLGAFSSYDDLLYLKYWDSWDHCRYIPRFREKYGRVALVRPVTPSEECSRQFALWREQLQKKGFRCEEINWDQIPDAYGWNDLVLFTDEDQRRGARALLCMEDQTYHNDERSLTFLEMTRAMCEPPEEKIFLDLRKKGVHVLMLKMERTDSEYQKKLFQQFQIRAERYGSSALYVHDEEAPQFYGSLYTEEYARIVGRHMFLMEKQNSFTRLKDCDEPCFHISGGERLTTDQSENADSSIFFFGPCLAIGPYVEDRHTIESFLQRKLNEEGYLYRAVNCGCWESGYSELLRIASTPMKKGDVAVVFFEGKSFTSTDCLDLLQILEENNAPAEWMLDSPVHGNDRIHQLYAEAIFSRLKERALRPIQPESGEPRCTPPRKIVPSASAVKDLYLDRYFWNMPPAKGKRVANIGIHGNPFTNGHLHLAKTALNDSDRLIVLVLEEEMALFSFAERYAMACAALKGLDDVIVVPSGPFHGTKTTNPGYFTRSESSMDENVLNEFSIFASLIAPALGINVRYIGEEPLNPMMMRFNRILTSVLQEHKIEVVEIPRANAEDRPISASEVRRLVPDRLDDLKQLVPPTTLDIILCSAL